MLFQTTRHNPKDFLQRRPNGKGWKWGLDDVRRVLYRLPELATVEPGQLVFLCEGEKSADAVRGLGAVATTNPMGAGKWEDAYTETLAGLDVVVLPDQDAAGLKHAYNVARQLDGKASSVRVLELGTRAGYDPADWVADGGTWAELVKLANETPLYNPDTAPAVMPEKDGWQVFTLADAYAPRPPVEYLVEKLLPLPSLTILYGAPGSMKTMVLADLAACVAGGVPWLDCLPNEQLETGRVTKQASVLWADFDNGPRTMHERIASAGRARNLAPDAPLFYLSMPNPWLDMSSWDGADVLLRRITSLDAKLVVVDNLRDVSGRVEENSSEMGVVMSNFRRVTEESGAAVVVVHHQRKGNGGGGRAGDNLRGHSSIEAAIDLALRVERENNSDTVTVSATKTRGVDVFPFAALFTYEHKPGTTELSSCQFFGVETTGGKSDGAIRRAVLETVKDTPNIQKTALAERVKQTNEVGVNRVRAQIDVLVARGKLRVMPGENTNALVFSIPADDPHDTVG